MERLNFILWSYSSYPTYEEWKLNVIYWTSYKKISSYPTYEEWKLASLKYQSLFILCSYPTYEEWKQIIWKYNLRINRASFLSYL